MKAGTRAAVGARGIAVIGLGNPHRGDDAVGLDVVRRLRGRQPADVPVIEIAGDCLELVDMWREFSVTYVIDAARSGKPAGTVHRIENDNCGTGRDMVRCSGHAFGLVEAVELARALGRGPRRLIVYAIEGRVFDDGAGLTLEVAAAIETVVGRLLAEMRQLEFESNA